MWAKNKNDTNPCIWIQYLIIINISQSNAETFDIFRNCCSLLLWPREQSRVGIHSHHKHRSFCLSIYADKHQCICFEFTHFLSIYFLANGVMWIAFQVQHSIFSKHMLNECAFVLLQAIPLFALFTKKKQSRNEHKNSARKID